MHQVRHRRKHFRGGGGTTWNPNDIGDNMSLDSTKLIATHVAPPTHWNAVRATLGKTSLTGAFETQQTAGGGTGEIYSVIGITYGTGDINTDTIIPNSYVYYGGGGGGAAIYKKIGTTLTKLADVPVVQELEYLSLEFDRANDTLLFRHDDAIKYTADISELTGEMFPHVSYRFDTTSKANFDNLVSTVSAGITPRWE